MKTIIFNFCLIVVSISFGQTEDFGRWKFGTSTSFNKNYYGDFGANEVGSTSPCSPDWGLNRIDLTTGIIGQYALTRKLEIGMGISYSRKSHMYDYYEIHGNNIFCSSLFYYPPIKFSYLEIPVFARYNFLKTKLNFHVELGVITEFLLEETYYYNSKFSLSGQAGLGISYTIFDALNISATAYFKRKLANFDKLRDVFNPNTVSVELRVAYILKSN
ncbi:MAG: outer membrane beta-barrel protein [Crocinitomicaceae bacterium]|nr:outer membrane beta-barrel protein [Crocinitomicaceae bacterium]